MPQEGAPSLAGVPPLLYPDKSGFRVAPHFHTKPLEVIFRHKVFKMLLSKGKITKDLFSILLSWRYSGFNVFCGPRIQPGDQQAMENLARYSIRAFFSQERMTYVTEEANVIYQFKNKKGTPFLSEIVATVVKD